jgi:carbon monoxide dehydrogenase subunit G
MDFENEFVVDAPIDEVYAAMLDLERVAPAMPGAEVLEKVDDDNYKVGIKVKVGPVSMQYRGDVTFVDKDPDAHSAKLHVKAREARGQGTANADVKLSLAEEDGKTRGTMKAEVQLAGKAASMGRGIIQDVSARLVQQFANNLATMLGGPAEQPTTVESDAIQPDAVPAAGAGASGAGGAAGAAAAAATAAVETGVQAASGEEPKPKPAPAPAPEAAEINALALGASMAKDRASNPKLIGVVVALILGFVILRRARH